MWARVWAATLFFSLLGAAGAMNAAPCEPRVAANCGFKSATIIELCTSEGCDSCPPADKWFSTLSYAREGVVPLAFHVDCWD